MSLYGEFRIPAKTFALQYTLEEMPETVIETERVVATDRGLTPYFWVDSTDVARFERVTEDDPSIEDLRRLDEFDRTTLYRAEWTEHVDALVYAYTQIDATILEATGQHDEWELKMRFDDRERF